LSESLYGVLIGLSLLAALRLRERATTGRALALGAAIGLAALTRSEALLLVAMLGVPIALSTDRGRRLRMTVLVCVAALAVCLPWCVRNSLQFDQPTLIWTGDGSVIAGSNVDSTYHGPELGGWDFEALYRTPAGRHVDPNEAVQSERWREEGITYARHHAGRLPVVLAARALRTWDLFPFSPIGRARIGSGVYRHVYALEYVAQLMLLATVALAIVGARGLRRRRRPLWPLIVPLALVTFSSMLGHGDPRYRHAGDVALVVLAGIGASLATTAVAARQCSRTAST
jgi:hypothetical protein